MSLEFLQPDAARATDVFAPVARTPMERAIRAAGGRLDLRDGWNVAVAYGPPEQEREAIGRAGGWADVSYLGKLEIQASPEDLPSIVAAASGAAGLEFGRATRAAGAWWCLLTPARVLVICEPGQLGALRERVLDAAASAAGRVSVTDVSTVFAAMTILGPNAREIFARFCALDLRPAVTPVTGLRPGSIARQPGLLIREAEDRYLILFGWAVGEYMWTVVDDAARRFGAVPVGADALEAIAEEVHTGA